MDVRGTLVLNQTQKDQLHTIAKKSILSGLKTGEPLTVELNKYDRDLQTKRATFVTLHKNSQLRGCIGILEALRPLVEDVAYNAYSAAFSDSRFPPVSDDEIDQLDIHISILDTPVEMNFSSEEDLVAQLQPGIDGLIMQDGTHRGTFLPAVWDAIADKRDFLNHLKLKAGLPKNYWSDSIKVLRYTVEEF